MRNILSVLAMAVGLAITHTPANAATTCDLIADSSPSGSSYVRCSDNGGPSYRVFPRLAWDMLTGDMDDAAAANFNGSIRFYGYSPEDIPWAQAQAASGMKMAVGGWDKGNRGQISYANAYNYAVSMCPYVVGLSLPDEGLEGGNALTTGQMTTIATAFRAGCPSALIIGDHYQTTSAAWYNTYADVIAFDGYAGYAGPNWGKEINIEALTSDFTAFRAAVTPAKPVWITWLPGWGSTVWDLPVMTLEESKETVLMAITKGANGAIEFPWCVDDYDCAAGKNLPDTTYEWPITTYIQGLLTQPLLYSNDSNNMTVSAVYNGSATSDVLTRLKRKNSDYLLIVSQYKNGTKKDTAHYRGINRDGVRFCFSGKTITSVTNVEDGTVYALSDNCFTEPGLGRIGIAQRLGANHSLGGSTMYTIKAQ